jgi:serine/threonine protein kinase
MGVQLGNPEYMAPELLVRVPFVRPNVCTDVFSVAVVLFEALTGTHPFRHGDRMQARTVRELMPEFQYIELEQALNHALRCDPERRTPTMAALRDDLELAHDCILAQRGDRIDEVSGAAHGARLLRLDSLRPAAVLADDEEPRARFLEVVRDTPGDEVVAPEPFVAPVVSLRSAMPAVTEPIDDPEEQDGGAPARAAAVVAAFASPPPDLTVMSKATQGWFATHVSSVILGTGIVAGVGATLASQRLGESIFTTPARVAELEAASDVCEQTLVDTRASLAQTLEDLGIARELARNHPGSPRGEASPVVPDEHPTADTPTVPTSVPPRSPGMASAARHRSIRRSLDKVLAAVQRCDEDAGGGRISTLRARIRVEPSGEASAVELMNGASIAVCVTKAVRSRRYQAGDEAEWIRHDFVFESEETP